MWNAIGLVGSGLTLFAFIAAVAAWAYRRATLVKTELIRSASEKDRARLVESALEGFRVDTRSLGAKQKFDLLMEQMKRRAERVRLIAILVFAVFLLGTGVAVTGLVVAPEPGPGVSVVTATAAGATGTIAAESGTPPETASATARPVPATGESETGAPSTAPPGTGSRTGSPGTAVPVTVAPATVAPETGSTGTPGGKVTVLCDGDICTVKCEPPCGEVTFASKSGTARVPVPAGGSVPVPAAFRGTAFTLTVAGKKLESRPGGKLDVRELVVRPVATSERPDVLRLDVRAPRPPGR